MPPDNPLSSQTPPPPRPAWARLISNYDKGFISYPELQSQLFEHLVRKSPDDFEAVLAALRSHADEFIRTTFADNLVQMIQTHRKVIDYSVEVRPLEDKIGCRVQIGGGYTAAYDRNPAWLAGRECHEGRLFGDVKIDEHVFPAALVRLDYLLELPAAGGGTRRGSYLILYPRYKDHSWSEHEGVVVTYLMESPPQDATWWTRRDDYEIESHATYRFLDD